MTAFSYLRVSSKGQIEGDGFPRQRQCVEAYVNTHPGTEVVREFVEEGISGTKDSLDRPALTELLAALKTDPRGVTLVLVERADRLARDLMISEILLSEFRKMGVQVISAECGTDLTVDDDDPTKKLIRQVLGAVSEWEKNIIVQKTRLARAKIRTATGRCEGRKPYGARLDEAETLAYMVRLHVHDDWSVQAVTDWLNNTRRPTRGGGRWHKTAVHRILAREILK
jgi:DNA invertase Pin-like site-specific DNA recombinase